MACWFKLPLPKWVNPDKVINFISPEKDVDGFHPVNVGKLLRGEPCPLPCTPYGIQQMLVRSGYSPEGKHVVICGRSNIVGKPLAALLMQKKPGANATVTVCHTGTKDIKKHTLQADILVAAMGAPKVITADMVREGCVVIDVGVNRVPDPAAAKGFSWWETVILKRSRKSCGHYARSRWRWTDDCHHADDEYH